MVWFAHDSALEGDGFELLVPRHEIRGFPRHPGHRGLALRRRKRYDKVPLIPIEPRPACTRRPGRARSFSIADLRVGAKNDTGAP